MKIAKYMIPKSADGKLCTWQMHLISSMWRRLHNAFSADFLDYSTLVLETNNMKSFFKFYLFFFDESLQNISYQSKWYFSSLYESGPSLRLSMSLSHSLLHTVRTVLPSHSKGKTMWAWDYDMAMNNFHFGKIENEIISDFKWLQYNNELMLTRTFHGAHPHLSEGTMA